MEYQKDNFSGDHKKQDGVTRQQGNSYIVRKAEKLTTALYLVTDFLSDKEPLKWKVREASVDVLSDVAVVAIASSSEKLTALRIAIKKIDYVISCLDIASSLRMMTEMNANVLRREYMTLKNNIEAEWSRTQEKGKVLLSERFFEVGRTEDDNVGDTRISAPKVSPELNQKIDARPTQPQTSTPKIEQRTETNPVFRPTPTAPSINQTAVQRVPEQTQQRPVVATHEKYVAPAKSFVAQPRPIVIDREVISRPRVDDSRDDRRKIILALLKQKPAVNVGDIAKSIPGVSEKTIQRELLSMVGEGILTKRGERRWSTYALRDM